MEFKGTKGIWIVEKAESDSSGRGVYRVATWNIPDNPDLQYNAQLISKAPEMLQMLKRVLHEYQTNMDLTGNDIQYEIEQLIKEATTL